METAGETVTIREAAKALNRSVRSLRDYIKKGMLPATLEKGRTGPQYRIPAEAVQALAVRLQTPQTGSHDVAMAGARELWDRIETLAVRNGYLQARVDILEGQVKALGPAPKRGFWARIRGRK